MNGTLKFDICGVKVDILSSDGDILGELRRDFEWFLIAGDGSPADVRVELCAEPVPSGRYPGPDSPRSYRATDEGDVRSVDYQGRAVTVYDFKAERGKIVCPDKDLLHELSYLLVLSRVGERLDRRGYHRVHGLGFGYDGRTGLILLPVGGGKTTLVLEMLKDPAFKLYSEDTPVIDSGGGMHPFPLRLGINGDRPLPGFPGESQRVFRRRKHGPKILLDLGVFRDRVASSAGMVDWIIDGSRPSGASPSIRRVGRWGVVKSLVVNLFIGWGVPQGAEYLLRPSWTARFRLLEMAVRRGRALFSLIRRARAAKLVLGSDGPENVRIIREWILRDPHR